MVVKKEDIIKIPDTEELIKIYKEIEENIIERLLKEINKKSINLERIILDISWLLATWRINFSLWNEYETKKYYLLWLKRIEEKIKNKELVKKIEDMIKKWIKEWKNYWEFISLNYWQLHIDAINSLIFNQTQYIIQAEQNTIRSIRSTLWRQANNKILLELLKKEMTDQALSKTKEEIIKALKKEWITALTTRDGKKLRLSFYVETIARSAITQSQNKAVLNRWVEVWITKYRRIEHPNCCEICKKHDWEIWDIEKQWVPVLIYHPNCRWTWEPVID